MGEPMSSRGGPSPSVPRTSYVSRAPGTARVWVVIVGVVIIGLPCVGHAGRLQGGPTPAVEFIGRRPKDARAGLPCAYTPSVWCRGMTVPLALLGLLEREPSHGYDLKRDYDTFFGRGKPLPFGQVYATLGRLARDGKVVVGETEAGGGPDRKRHVITQGGAAAVQAGARRP